jgi:trehalose 6-phosphate phosphatase
MLVSGFMALSTPATMGWKSSAEIFSLLEPRATARQQELERLCDRLRVQLRPIAGAIVEFKGLTASVHYRRAAESDLPAIETAVRAAVVRAGDLFRLNPGKKVFEILPRTGWDKGAAVRCINDHIGMKRCCRFT